MGPHSRQQSIQQSTNIICNRSTSLKLEKNVFITSDITIYAHRVDNNDATRIASLTLLPPLCVCLPWDAALHSSLTSSCLLQSCLACIPCIVASRKQLIVESSAVSSVNHRSPQYQCSDFGTFVDCCFDNEYRQRGTLWHIREWGGGYGGWGGRLVALIHIISGHMWFDPLTKKTFKRMVCRWYNILGGFGVETTNPTAPIIPPNVEVMTMHLLGASSGHRQWYGPKLPATMISGKHDVSYETAAKKRVAKVS